MEAHTCTLTMLEKIDECFENVMAFDQFLKCVSFTP